jgi:hypothetical protein
MIGMRIMNAKRSKSAERGWGGEEEEDEQGGREGGVGPSIKVFTNLKQRNFQGRCATLFSLWLMKSCGHINTNPAYLTARGRGP